MRPAQRTGFPWVLTNVTDTRTGRRVLPFSFCSSVCHDHNGTVVTSLRSLQAAKAKPHELIDYEPKEGEPIKVSLCHPHAMKASFWPTARARVCRHRRRCTQIGIIGIAEEQWLETINNRPDWLQSRPPFVRRPLATFLGVAVSASVGGRWPCVCKMQL